MAFISSSGEEKLIGWNGLQFLPETGEVEVAYLISKPFWGKGLTTEGASAALRYGFEQIGLKLIIALAHPENKASRRVMEKLGMSFTGLARYFGMDLCRYVIGNSSSAGVGQLNVRTSQKME